MTRAGRRADARKAWSYRNFRLLFVGQTVSALGNTLTPVALAFAVLDVTHSAGDLGYVLGAQSAAMVVFLLPGGVIADRWPRRAVMLTSDAVRGGAQAALGVLLVVGRPSVLVLGVLAAVTGAASATFSPASTGLTPALVDAEALQQANALQQTAASAAGIAGPAVAGVLVVTIGPGWGLIADAATFGFSVLLLARLHLERVPRPGRPHFVADLREGWGDFWSRPWFRDVVIGASAWNFLYAAFTVLGPVTSDRHYHGAAAWATVSTAAGLGAVVAGVFAVRLRPRRPLRTALTFGMLGCLAPLAFAALLPLPVLALGAALAGGGLILFESLWQTTVQRHIPEERLSRASSYDYFGSLVAYPAGLAAAGPIAAGVGATTLLWFVGGAMFVLTSLSLLLRSIRNLTDQVPAVAPTVAKPA